MQSISLADELTLEPAPRGRAGGRGRLPGRARAAGGEPRGARRCARSARRTGWDAPPLRLQIDKRIPRRRRARRRLGRRRRRAAPRARTPRGSATSELLLELARRARRRRARAGRARALAGHAAPASSCEPLPDAAAAARRCSCCRSAAQLSTAAVYAEADRLGLGARRAELGRAPGGARARRSSTARRCRAARELLHNDLQRGRGLAVPARSPRRCARRAAAGADAGARQRLGADRDRAVRAAPTRRRAARGARAAAALARPRAARAIAATPVDAAFAQPRRSEPPRPRAARGAARRATPTAPCVTIPRETR